jgi:hypothetical protein
MEILEKLMDNALEFKHTRQIIFDFMSLEESEEGRRLVFNCRKSKINEISMRNLSKDKEKEVYFLEPKMITSEVVESFLKYDTYEKEELFLNKAYYKDTNGNLREIYKNPAVNLV